MQITLLLVCASLVILKCEATPSPIVLIPGVMGSQLTVKDANNNECSTKNKYEDLWISPSRLLLHNHCAKKELSLRYDPDTDSYIDNAWVSIEVPGFGDTDRVEYITPHNSYYNYEYFHKMVEYFVKRGYKRGKSIRGAPYDWRLAADELQKYPKYFRHLKELIQKMYEENGNTKVTLVAHSMGGPVSLYFLNGFSGVNQAWKNKYIHAYVPLAGAWSGGAATVQSVVSGYHGIPRWFKFLHLYNWASKFLVETARTFESVPWLFPKPSVFGNSVIVSTPSKYYTTNDYKELFEDIGVPGIYRTYKRVQAINPGYPAPNVPTYCLYGVGVPTPKKFMYPKDLTPQNSIGMIPKIENGDGDGSVNTVSSEVCRKWSTEQPKFKVKSYNKVSHNGILSNARVLEDLRKIVRAPNKKIRRL